jgi:DNA-3-methyladenine glycosylase
MFGPPGHAYLFLLYGRSWAINLVTGGENQPHAVLIRALEPVRGVDLMARRRGKPPASRELCNGPGKLTQALAIDGRDYGRDLCGDELYLETGWHGKIARSARINVGYAGAWQPLGFGPAADLKFNFQPGRPSPFHPGGRGGKR